MRHAAEDSLAARFTQLQMSSHHKLLIKKGCCRVPSVNCSASIVAFVHPGQADARRPRANRPQLTESLTVGVTLR
jgi:hypothetical protein